MATCIRINGKKRTLCASALDRQVIIQTRAITTTNSDVDFSETFTASFTAWAAIETTRGKSMFDSVNSERDITHKIYIRYSATVTAESWLLFNNQRLDIIDVENLEERNRFLLLRCSDRGSDGKLASSI